MSEVVALVHLQIQTFDVIQFLCGALGLIGVFTSEDNTFKLTPFTKTFYGKVPKPYSFSLCES